MPSYSGPNKLTRRAAPSKAGSEDPTPVRVMPRDSAPVALPLASAANNLQGLPALQKPRVAVTHASPLKTAGFLFGAVTSNSFGNLLLAMGMDRMPDYAATSLGHYLYLLLTNHFLIPGAALSAAYLVFQLSLFSWADLSFVVPVIASSYVVTTLLSRFILGEPVQVERWIGVLLITFGVILVMRTPPSTKDCPEGSGRC